MALLVAKRGDFWPSFLLAALRSGEGDVVADGPPTHPGAEAESGWRLLEASGAFGLL